MWRLVRKIKKDDDAGDWIEGVKQTVIVPCEMQEAIIEDIMEKYDFLVKPTDATTNAELFVIALAKVLAESSADYNVCVLAEESQVPERRRIPYVCSCYSLSYRNLRQFFEHENIRL